MPLPMPTPPIAAGTEPPDHGRVHEAHELAPHEARDQRQRQRDQAAQLGSLLRKRTWEWVLYPADADVVWIFMAERGPNEKRLQEIFTFPLVQRQIGCSLAQVEDALKSWRAGARTVLAAHAEVLRHTARTKMCCRTASPAPASRGRARSLRTALDAGLIAAEEFTSLDRQAAARRAAVPIAG